MKNYGIITIRSGGKTFSSRFVPFAERHGYLNMYTPLREDLRRRLLDGDFSCEKELTMSLLCGKWKIVVIWHLSHEGPMRFGALLKLFGNRCSHRIMTKQLREMEYDGLITRNTCEEVKIEYSLTELGNSIVPIVDMMWSWGIEHMSYYAARVNDGHTADIKDGKQDTQ